MTVACQLWVDAFVDAENRERALGGRRCEPALVVERLDDRGGVVEVERVYGAHGEFTVAMLPGVLDRQSCKACVSLVRLTPGGPFATVHEGGRMVWRNRDGSRLGPPPALDRPGVAR